ncbi:MAG TPA: GTPase Era [Methylococcaceae bacterium]|nr:GTPase Era [Methylococcaceae bacterium]
MKCGYVAIVGRPNVGKSTLLNHLIGQKLSITSRKPQTTRHCIQGIKTGERGQIIFVDTPGLHEQEKRAMNRYLNRAAASVLDGVDAIVWVVEALAWTPDEERILTLLHKTDAPVLLAVNKADQIEDKTRLLPYLEEMAGRRAFAEIIPLSALRGTNLDVLEEKLLEELPEREPLYPPDQLSDRPDRFFAAEIIREKLIRALGHELPHALTVEIERYQEDTGITRIYALIWVEREGQKAIVIGKDGQGLKKVGERARHDLEKWLDGKVYLQLWVKVKKNWSDDERALHSLGYGV